jgi:hypothetical protein
MLVAERVRLDCAIAVRDVGCFANPGIILCLLARIRRSTLHAEVWDICQRVVEAIREVGCANHQRKLHDLTLVVELPQLINRAATDRRRASGYAVGVKNCGFVLFVKKRAVLVERECGNLLIGYADPLRRSGVSARSILAPIDGRRFQICQLLVAWLDRAFLDDGAVERQEILEHAGPVGHRPEKIRHLARFLGKGIVDSVNFRCSLFLRYWMNYSH